MNAIVWYRRPIPEGHCYCWKCTGLGHVAGSFWAWLFMRYTPCPVCDGLGHCEIKRPLPPPPPPRKRVYFRLPPKVAMPHIAILNGDRLEFCSHGYRFTLYVLFVGDDHVVVSGFEGGVTKRLPRGSDGSIVLDAKLLAELQVDAAECEPIDPTVSE